MASSGAGAGAGIDAGAVVAPAPAAIHYLTKKQLSRDHAASLAAAMQRQEKDEKKQNAITDAAMKAVTRAEDDAAVHGLLQAALKASRAAADNTEPPNLACTTAAMAIVCLRQPEAEADDTTLDEDAIVEVEGVCVIAAVWLSLLTFLGCIANRTGSITQHLLERKAVHPLLA